jgi:uncharacterized tellurite resistance protein B-like protein|tara:strand:+ start:1190 stop:1594 length:405 start_codon:yes stop_codon:yes gene_type:complete
MDSKTLINSQIVGISALLVHAAKIDDEYTSKEKDIILSFIKSFLTNSENADTILVQSEKLEADSNQLLNFTNIIKKDSLEIKKIVIQELWKIIISDKNTDEYESNLMRRICGLIYFPDKLSGEIKLRLLNGPSE